MKGSSKMRRFLLVGLFVGLVAILVVGGINRTLAQTSTPLFGSPNDKTQGLGAGSSTGETLPVPNAPATVKGIIDAVNSHAIELTASTGEKIEISGRGWRYAQEQGFSAQAGDPLSLSMLIDSNGRLEILSMENLNTQLKITLRDHAGKPLWNAASNQHNQP